MDKIKENLYKHIGMDLIYEHAGINIRENGQLVKRSNTENVTIETKPDNPGIIVTIKENTQNNLIQIPVIVTEEGMHDKVYNDFYIGDNSSVTILAGCAVHNDCNNANSHSGIHTFYIGKNSKVKYVEKHYGDGEYEERQINTDTIIKQDENSEFTIETIQLGGLNKARRRTYADLKENSSLNIDEKLMTSYNEIITTYFKVNLNDNNSKCNIISKAIAKNKSKQKFESIINGNKKCFGHVECNAILMDKAVVTSIPKIVAKTPEANITHEASIGKIAEDEIIKLMTLGLTEKEAEDEIIRSFLN